MPLRTCTVCAPILKSRVIPRSCRMAFESLNGTVINRLGTGSKVSYSSANSANSNQRISFSSNSASTTFISSAARTTSSGS